MKLVRTRSKEEVSVPPSWSFPHDPPSSFFCWTKERIRLPFLRWVKLRVMITWGHLVVLLERQWSQSLWYVCWNRASFANKTLWMHTGSNQDTSSWCCKSPTIVQKTILCCLPFVGSPSDPSSLQAFLSFYQQHVNLLKYFPISETHMLLLFATIFPIVSSSKDFASNFAFLNLETASCLSLQVYHWKGLDHLQGEGRTQIQQTKGRSPWEIQSVEVEKTKMWGIQRWLFSAAWVSNSWFGHTSEYF